MRDLTTPTLVMLQLDLTMIKHTEGMYEVFRTSLTVVMMQLNTSVNMMNEELIELTAELQRVRELVVTMKSSAKIG